MPPLAALSLSSSNHSAASSSSSSRSKKLAEGLECVVLACKILHGAKYPASAEAFAASDYAGCVARPLSRVFADPIFSTVEEMHGAADANGGTGSSSSSSSSLEGFLDGSAYRPSLAGRKLPRPVAMVPATAISVAGNRRAAWRRLLGDASTSTTPAWGAFQPSSDTPTALRAPVAACAPHRPRAVRRRPLRSPSAWAIRS